jgi:hypothetical protein
VTPARPTSTFHGVIDDFSDDLPYDLHDSIETDDIEGDAQYASSDADNDYEIDIRSPKRQRLSQSPETRQSYEVEPEENDTDYPVSSPPVIPSPVARRPISKPGPKFVRPTPGLPSTPYPQSQTPFLRPPRFRPTETSDSNQSHGDPLPEQFSPHRKGQKFVTGGLAAEVREWLVNIDSSVLSKSESLPSNAAHRPRDDSWVANAVSTPLSNTGQRPKDDPWVAKIMIDKISGGARAGMTLVKGRQYSDHRNESVGAIKVVLAGEGVATGLQKVSNVEVGKIVGIKGPVWEVIIEGEKWGVGVDWKVFG